MLLTCFLNIYKAFRWLNMLWDALSSFYFSEDVDVCTILFILVGWYSYSDCRNDCGFCWYLTRGTVFFFFFGNFMPGNHIHHMLADVITCYKNFVWLKELFHLQLCFPYTISSRVFFKLFIILVFYLACMFTQIWLDSDFSP